MRGSPRTTKTRTDVAPWFQRESEVAVSHRSLAPGFGKVLAAHLLVPERDSWLKEGRRREEVKFGRDPWYWHQGDAGVNLPLLQPLP